MFSTLKTKQTSPFFIESLALTGTSPGIHLSWTLTHGPTDEQCLPWFWNALFLFELGANSICLTPKQDEHCNLRKTLGFKRFNSWTWFSPCSSSCFSHLPTIVFPILNNSHGCPRRRFIESLTLTGTRPGGFQGTATTSQSLAATTHLTWPTKIWGFKLKLT